MNYVIATKDFKHIVIRVEDEEGYLVRHTLEEFNINDIFTMDIDTFHNGDYADSVIEEFENVIKLPIKEFLTKIIAL